MNRDVELLFNHNISPQFSIADVATLFYDVTLNIKEDSDKIAVRNKNTRKTHLESTIDVIIHSISHEYLHLVIYELEGFQASEKLDYWCRNILPYKAGL